MTPVMSTLVTRFGSRCRGQQTASRSGTGVASLERLVVAALAEVVGAGMHDDGALRGVGQLPLLFMVLGTDLRR